ncbi:hypothetical protein JRQ81_001184 [Phrynocephalus forsythii]|uniref:Protein AHNAK2 n=1 Tax=Phrynocephalus forsythii TaxID=171643 RepID=A0A9Q0YA00_9SAUR|nr:hypothetical protein JRQ81_001184 [Phrynocephalus forsythii]
MPKFYMPKFGVSIPKEKAELPLPDAELLGPELRTDVTVPSMELGFDSKNQKIESDEKDIVGKDTKFKMPKFKLPSFSWSPKKEVNINASADGGLKETSATMCTSDLESELTLTVEEVEGQTVELEVSLSEGKDTERRRLRRPQFSMPKISLPKMKSHKGEIYVPEGDTDMSVPMTEEGEISLPEKDFSASVSTEESKSPKVYLPHLQLYKPEIKGPKLDIEFSLNKSDTEHPVLDISVPKQELKLGDVDESTSSSVSEIKLPMAQGLEISLEEPSTEISVCEGEQKTESVDVKVKKPKFQMPTFGIFSKGKAPEIDTSLPAEDTAIPQLKNTTDIADIGVEAAGFDITGTEKTVQDGSIQVPQIPTSDIVVGVTVPSAVLSVIQPERGTQDSVSTEAKIQEEKKDDRVDAEQKEGHFKKPKFKMPSFNWSPKKEASLKTSIQEPLEEIKQTTDRDGEAKEPLSQDQEVPMDQDAETTTKKGQVKRPHFTMPKISLPRTKLPKSQDHMSKVEGDVAIESDTALVQIPDIEMSFSTRKEEETEISVKMPKDMSKAEIKTFQTDIKADVELPLTDRSFKLKTSEIAFEGETDVQDASTKLDDTEGVIRLPKLQMPTFKFSSEGEGYESGIKIAKIEGVAIQQQTPTEIEILDGEAPVLEAKGETIDSEIKMEAGKIKMPQAPSVEMKGSDMSVVSSGEKDVQGEGEHKVKPEEGQTEEPQGWFRMPKFRMPSFGRSSSKGKKDEAEVESSSGKVPIPEAQVEIKVPEVPAHIDIEPHSGKDVLECKVVLPEENIRGISVEKEKRPDTGLFWNEGTISKTSGKTDSQLSVQGTKTYAEIVKHGAEALQTHKPTVTVSTLETSVPKVDIDVNLPKCDASVQQYETKSAAEVSPTEIPVSKPDGEIDPAVIETEMVMQSPTAVAKGEKMESKMKSPKKDIQGKESIFKMPKFGVPSFGWSTTKATDDVPEVATEKEVDVVPSEMKMDVSVTDEGFEIIDFPTQEYEKEVVTESDMKVEERDASSKKKATKFKMPKFGSLRSKSQSSEVHVDQTKMEAEMSVAKSEGERLGIQAEKTVMKGPKLYFSEKTAGTMDIQSGDSELSFHIPKLKMLKFTHSTSAAEAQILTSEDTTDIKCTVPDSDDASQMEFRISVPEEKVEDTSSSIQKSKVKITTLSKPTIQRTQVEHGVPSTELSFEETTTHIERPGDFSTKISTEKTDTLDVKIQKSVAKITTLIEPDIQTTRFEIKLPSVDSFISGVPLHIQEPYTEGEEIKLQGKSECGLSDSDMSESFSTQIVKESEIPPTEVKTAAFGFSLLKVKIQESHVNLDRPIKLSPSEYVSEMHTSEVHHASDESSGEATQKTGFAELKIYDKGGVGELDEGASSATTLTKLKRFTVEVQSASELAEDCSDKQPKQISEPTVEVTEKLML